MTKAQRRDQRVAAAIAAGRKSSYEQRLEYAAKRPGLLGGVRPLIERLRPWDYAKLSTEEWKAGLH